MRPRDTLFFFRQIKRRPGEKHFLNRFLIEMQTGARNNSIMSPKPIPSLEFIHNRRGGELPTTIPYCNRCKSNERENEQSWAASPIKFAHLAPEISVFIFRLCLVTTERGQRAYKLSDKIWCWTICQSVFYAWKIRSFFDIKDPESKQVQSRIKLKNENDV